MIYTDNLEKNHLFLSIQAALRKVCSIAHPPELKTNEDLQQLVKPKLMDSFLLCSGHDENFV